MHDNGIITFRIALAIFSALGFVLLLGQCTNLRIENGS